MWQNFMGEGGGVFFEASILWEDGDVIPKA